MSLGSNFLFVERYSASSLLQIFLLYNAKDSIMFVMLLFSYSVSVTLLHYGVNCEVVHFGEKMIE